MTDEPDKYLVIKRSTWEVICRDDAANDYANRSLINAIAASVVPDATVIRGQDVLAGPALHGYAAGAALVVACLPKEHPDRAKFQKVADLFHDRAVEADELGNKKVPD